MKAKPAVCAVVIACLFLGACEKAVPKQEEQPLLETDGLSVEVAPELMKRLRLGPASTRSVQASLRVAARVEADETRIVRVSAPLSGRILRMNAVPGTRVERGQVLAEIRSADLSDAQFELIKAFSQRHLAERAVERAKRLLEAGVIGEAELQRREAELQQANAEVNALHDQLRLLGFTEEQINRLETTRRVNATIPIVATSSGTVMERRYTIGQMVEAAETLFVVADLSSVWLVADVPEQTARGIRPGMSVTAEIAALPGEVIRGRLSFVSAIVEPETRTVRARLVLPNPLGKYKPAMLAAMNIQDEAEYDLVVPVTAVVREGDQDHVFVQVEEGRFQLRRVTIGGEFGADRVLEDGLSAEETIVLDGAFHLNNERKKQVLRAG